MEIMLDAKAEASLDILRTLDNDLLRILDQFVKKAAPTEIQDLSRKILDRNAGNDWETNAWETKLLRPNWEREWELDKKVYTALFPDDQRPLYRMFVGLVQLVKEIDLEKHVFELRPLVRDYLVSRGHSIPLHLPPPLGPTDSQGEQYVTLDQAAGFVNRGKKTLERYLKKEKMPQPDVEGGGGRPHEWIWSTLRPWLEKTFGKSLPERLPSRSNRPVS
jgi:hypothetical protein